MWAPEDEYKQPLLYGNNSSGNNNNNYSKNNANGGGKGKIVNESKCNDILFMLLFLATVIGMIVVSSYSFRNGQPQNLIPTNQIIEQLGNTTETVVIGQLQNAVAQLKQDKDILIYSVIMAVALAAIWLELLKRFTRFFIYATLCLGVALVAVLGILFVMLGRKESSEATQIVGYCLAASTLLLICVIVYLKKNIDLTCAMYTETVRGIQNRPSVFGTAFICIAVFLGFITFWTASSVYLFSIPGEAVIQDSGSSEHTLLNLHFNTKIRNLMYFMIFAFFWVTAFISAVFQHTVAGAVSNWYFSRDPTGESEVGSPNAFTSLGRALSTSLGSLAFGSLIIAFIEFMQAMLAISKNSNSENKLVVMIISCLQCILGCIESILRWVNKFGYIYVAMHGYSFCTSTKGCFDLISRNMFSAVVMDFIGSFVLLLGKILGAAASALFTTSVLYASGRSLNPLVIGLSAIFAFCIFNLFSHIIGIGSDTIFVCYLEDLETNGPNNLYISPDLHELLQQESENSNQNKSQVV
ncbi:hypothetical protein DLAC_00870 [Tieghemostelium lacteum]|uniref:Choline transporter-like protein n=1 Tax=Tieghemostelium lacteum TaxID=361077 RepID=A0A152A7G7_TIELA|nr:hypothetical protein DLAC_00870 [Tieghemostelium lacteum]|eukprot:KYR02071.1 hypothetical protein DLAC_00870 [Tieghemostelium lacteum]